VAEVQERATAETNALLTGWPAPQMVAIPRERARPLAAVVTVHAYLLAIVAAEALTALLHPAIGVLCHVFLLIVLLAHSAWRPEAAHRPVLPALALLPILRILSVVMPIRGVDPIFWHLLIGVPLAVATFLALRAIGFSWADIGLGPGWAAPWWQLVIALSAVPLSLAGYLIIRPEFPQAGAPLMTLIGGALVLTFFSGFLEELIFRGVIQHAAGDALGGSGIFYSSLAFAAVYIGSLSPAYIIFIGLVGLFFGWCVQRTGSIWGVALAHSWLNIGLLLVWPLVAAGLPA
jgi:membrane protease YdiL (CAAX protease family)